MQVPEMLWLKGTLKHQSECLGKYTLTGRKAYGAPVWKHEGQDRYIAKVSSGNWMVLSEASLTAKKDTGKLLLKNTGQLPHVSRATWQEYDGKGGWQDAPALKCVAEADTVAYYYCYYCYSHYYDD